VGLYQTVGVEKRRLSGIERDLLFLLAHPRHEP